MYKLLVKTAAGLALMSAVLPAQNLQRKASFLNGGEPGRGKCTAEIVVDGAADVEIRGDVATVRNLSGQTPQWRRFECTGPLPSNVSDFRFQGVDGRGRQTLFRDPRNGGVAVIRIEDPDNGSEGYTFDIFWGGFQGSRPGGPPQVIPTPPDRGGNGRPFGGGIVRRFTTDQAIGVCREEVRRTAANRWGTNEVDFRRINIDDNPGRNDWVIGSFVVLRGRERNREHRFACSVNFDNGQVRSVDIDPEVRGQRPPDPVQVCQAEVTSRVRQQGFSEVRFDSVRVDDRPGRNDWVVGNLRADRQNGFDSFQFNCRVDLNSGEIKSVDLNRR